MNKFLLIACIVAALVAAKKCPDDKATKLRAMLCAPEDAENECGSKKEIADLVDDICLDTEKFKKDVKNSGDYPSIVICLLQLEKACVNKTHVDIQKIKSCVDSTQNAPLMSAMSSILGGSEQVVRNITGLIGQILNNTIGGQ